MELCGRRCHMLFGQADKLLESCDILDRHIGQHLAIQQYVGFFKGIDEATVREPVRPRGRADASDPQLPEVPLPILAPGVGILLSLIYRFCR